VKPEGEFIQRDREKNKTKKKKTLEKKKRVYGIDSILKIQRGNRARTAILTRLM
jgi:hypothetical protein